MISNRKSWKPHRINKLISNNVNPLSNHYIKLRKMETVQKFQQIFL